MTAFYLDLESVFEQSFTFSFEAAHELGANVPEQPSHPYARVHGHSFVVTLTLRADAVGPEGWIMDFADLKAICAGLQSRLDHQFLNAIPGLERPTLEAMAAWIFHAAAKQAPLVWRVDLARPTLNERVSYYAR